MLQAVFGFEAEDMPQPASDAGPQCITTMGYSGNMLMKSYPMAGMLTGVFVLFLMDKLFKDKIIKRARTLITVRDNIPIFRCSKSFSILGLMQFRKDENRDHGSNDLNIGEKQIIKVLKYYDDKKPYRCCNSKYFWTRSFRCKKYEGKTLIRMNNKIEHFDSRKKLRRKFEKELADEHGNGDGTCGAISRALGWTKVAHSWMDFWDMHEEYIREIAPRASSYVYYA